MDTDNTSFVKLLYDTVEMHFKQYRNTPSLKEVLELDRKKQECLERIVGFYKENNPKVVESSTKDGIRCVTFDLVTPNESVKVKEDGNCIVFAGNSGFELWCPGFCRMVFDTDLKSSSVVPA